jgi:hypothetical protein
MGLHKDGSKSGMSLEVREEWDQVFWECYAVEVFQVNLTDGGEVQADSLQANRFSRP